jgi:hypothetical protein
MSAQTTTSTDSWVELADRSGDGLDVRLLWDRATGRLKVTVTSFASGRTAEVRVAPEDALEAFHHPFAYRHRTLVEALRPPVGAAVD